METSSLATVGNQTAMTMVLEEPHENGTLFASQGPHDSTVQLREETDVSSATNSTSVRPVTEDQLERASSINRLRRRRKKRYMLDMLRTGVHSSMTHGDILVALRSPTCC